MKRKIIGKLIKWKEIGKDRRPLLLCGAKQVGKTYGVKEFASLCYENLVYVNFCENPEMIEGLKEKKTVEEVVKGLENLYKTIIIPGKTLIFLDDIELHKIGVGWLQLFQREGASYHIIGACNTMEAPTCENIQTEKVFPMDFEEFLWATGKDELAETIRSHYETMEPVPIEIHKDCLEEWKKYLLTGGMPTVVCAHIYHKNPTKEQEYKELIVDSYVSDMTNLFSNLKGAKAKEAYLSIPGQLCKENRKFQYKYIKEGARASFYADTIHLLKEMGVVFKCEKRQDESCFKLYMNDVGLLAIKLRLDAEKIENAANGRLVRGLTENYVACSLHSKGYELGYWVSGGIAEIDFLIEKQEGLIPIVLNLEESTKRKSLKVYEEKYKPPYGIVLSKANFKMEHGIKSVPLYGVFAL